MKDLDGKGDAALLKQVEEAKDKLKKSLESGTIEEIKKDSEALTEPLHKIAEQVYAQAQAAQQQGAQAGATAEDASAKGDDNVVDADYKVVDDEDKK